MKYLPILLLTGAAILGACSTTANNGTTGNMRGTNTNTGYVMNSESNVKPSMPTNVTNISPPSMNKIMGNANTNHNSAVNSNSKANEKK